MRDEDNNANLTKIEDKIRELTAQNAVVNSRVDRKIRLARAISGFERDLDRTVKHGESIRLSKSWTEDYYNKNFSVSVNLIQSWFIDIKDKQERLSFIEVEIFFIVATSINSRNA